MEHPGAAGAACGATVIGVGPDEAALILMKHCRDMKQQETRLRLITLLLLLSCSALFLFTVSAGLWQRGSSTGHQITAEQSPAYLRQESGCPADSQTNVQKLRIHLKSLPASDVGDGYIQWYAMSGEPYNTEKRAVVIPEGGFYFVYVRIDLGCHDGNAGAVFQNFYVELRRWNEGYNQTLVLTQALDGLTCSSEGFRTLFVGQLFDLWKGDHVSVWIGEGFKLITKSSFGAYLA